MQTLLHARYGTAAMATAFEDRLNYESIYLIKPINITRFLMVCLYLKDILSYWQCIFDSVVAVTHEKTQALTLEGCTLKDDKIPK